ncbi:hypothetical protein HAX54_039380 [Datura stramonium]|uniref:Uncharacterized protein n=1 Tax=Datura stramonium TaxID=4076 RepID=A0ABS8VMJ9_DATST|nr:hypothetical protein [Datura stramonium]
MASSTDKPSSPPHISDISPLSSLPPPNEGILRSLPMFPSVASLGSSMKTSPTSLSPEEGSDGSPSHSSPEAIELSSLLDDIRSHYTTQEPDSPSLPKTPSSPTDSASLSPDVGENLIDITMSESESLDDSVPLASLKRGARTRLRRSTGVPTSGSKFSCVSSISSCTRAHRSEVVGPSIVPNSSVPKTRAQLEKESTDTKGTNIAANQIKTLASGKVVRNMQKRHEWMEKRSKFKKDNKEKETETNIRKRVNTVSTKKIFDASSEDDLNTTGPERSYGIPCKCHAERVTRYIALGLFTVRPKMKVVARGSLLVAKVKPDFVWFTT